MVGSRGMPRARCNEPESRSTSLRIDKFTMTIDSRSWRRARLTAEFGLCCLSGIGDSVSRVRGLS